MHVSGVPSSQPPRSNSATMTGRPPTSSTSTIEYAPNGRMFTTTGSLADSSLNSCWLMTSVQKSSPAERAISTACSATLVEPPIAMVTVTALRIDAGVTMSRGRMPLSRMVTRQSTSSPGNCSTRRRSSDAAETMCSGSMPSTAMNVCMVL